MPKNIFRHSLDIQACVIMLDPDVVIENRQLKEGRILVELELHLLFDGLKTFEESDALSYLLLKSFRSDMRIRDTLCTRPRSFTKGFRSMILAIRQFWMT